MNIYKNLMFLQGHFTDPHMDDAHDAAVAAARATPRQAEAPGASPRRPWWQRWSRFGTAQPINPERQDACCQC